jgi:hypothetical protein
LVTSSRWINPEEILQELIVQVVGEADLFSTGRNSLLVRTHTDGLSSSLRLAYCHSASDPPPQPRGSAAFRPRLGSRSMLLSSWRTRWVRPPRLPEHTKKQDGRQGCEFICSHLSTAGHLLSIPSACWIPLAGTVFEETRIFALGLKLRPMPASIVASTRKF